MSLRFVKQVVCVLFLHNVIVVFSFAGGKPEAASGSSVELLAVDEASSYAMASREELVPVPVLMFDSGELPEVLARGEQVMKALSAAHPRRIGPATFRNGDWAVKVRGEWFYYADGRFLPENLRSRAGEYDRLPFYTYPEDLPSWKEPTEEESARFREAGRSRKVQPSKRSTFFFDAVWNVRTRADAWERVKTIRFLGKETLVHHAILEELALVEQRINRLAETDPQARDWIKSISSVSAWNWRNIADIQSRSNHAYGIAVDILPSSGAMRGLETYWLWTDQKKIDWWAVPYRGRYQPPDAVIKAFESYGFIWGGKWTFYDTMHFEYRPELLLLSGIELRGEY
jgi:hypothetical protein